MNSFLLTAGIFLAVFCLVDTNAKACSSLTEQTCPAGQCCGYFVNYYKCVNSPSNYCNLEKK